MSRGARRAATTIVGAEVALSVMLLVGAGLILRSFAQLLSVNPGFRMENVMTIEMRLPAGRYAVPASREGFYQRVLAEVKALPSVQEAGAAIVVPLTGNNWSTPFQRADQPIPAGERPPEVGFQSASNGYFRSLEIPLLSGRYFDERDRASGAPVAIVSEAIERRFFPQGSAVGQQIIIQDGQRFEIVGVVGNIRRAGLRDEPRADLYFPFERTVPLSTTLFVRTTGEPTRALPELRAAIARIEPGVTLQRARALADIAGESERVTRALLWLLGVFAGTSLALAAIGIYSIMSYAVRHRAREIGTRIALGATRRQIVWLVMRQGALIAAIGSVVGLVMGQATTRYLSSILFGVSGNDPWTLTSAVALLAGTIMLACYLPARRAASVDPARTLADR